MSKEALLKYQEYRRIMKITLAFLEKNKEKLWEHGKSEILKSQKLYIYELEGRTLKKFKLSILGGHFKWIMDRCLDSTIEFNDYTSNFIPSLQPAYIDFYISLIQYIPSLNQPKEIKENLEDFFNMIKDDYL